MGGLKFILLTTSRRPNDKIRTLSRDIGYSIPYVIRINRGKLSQNSLAEKAIALNADRVIIIDRSQSRLVTINFFSLSPTGLKIIYPKIVLSEIKLRREFNNVTKRKFSTSITINSMNSDLENLSKSISTFLDLPITTSYKTTKKEFISMHFSLTSNKKLQITFLILNQMIEIGPRLTISKLIWKDA